jgi:hypothetical protein
VGDILVAWFPVLEIPVRSSSFPHQRASYASGDFDAKYIPGIEDPIPEIARFQFTVLSSCGIPNSPSVNFELALT